MKIKTKLRISIYVNTKKRVVTVVTENDTSLLAIDMICRFESNKGYITEPSVLSRFMIPNRFTGIARCTMDDKFDESVGIRIAVNKLYSKLYNSIRKQLVLYKKYLANVAKSADDELVLSDTSYTALEYPDKDTPIAVRKTIL